MAKKLMRYEFKPDDGGSIEGGHTIWSLATHVAEPRCLTERELEKVVMADLGEVVAVKDVGEFRRYQ